LKKKDKVVEVYKAPNEMEAQVIKGLLESYGIPCYLKSHASPSVHLFTVDGMGEFKVMVLETMAEKARNLIMSDKKDV
jgi:hypothetical protein